MTNQPVITTFNKNHTIKAQYPVLEKTDLLRNSRYLNTTKETIVRFASDEGLPVGSFPEKYIVDQVFYYLAFFERSNHEIVAVHYFNSDDSRRLVIFND